ncbi:MAG: calcium/sodium antiporter [endosymbiont of Galathealinum brachiosum]|uniref:Calcium/sodium antiporter n=1 Tax=endosymbiont of Galathealinum brachiosum TaxID=2200906 RepID=A0A370D9W8_9GAMM|nr:MAG: calcium/sodium antiporter [endosymbiont of Galathealinum brachiosum]
MLIDFTAILAGFALLIWSADLFVTGASATARNLGVSPLIIGLTIVGFGTSAPEMLVASIAAYGGNPGLAIGNAIGSNITNIALVLGATAVIVPLTVHSSILKREYPLLIAATLLAVVLMATDNALSTIDGILMMLLLFVLMTWVVYQALEQRKCVAGNECDVDPLSSEFDQEIPDDMPMGKAIWLLLSGIVLLLISSKMLVWGAINVATAFGVSDLIIGLTIVAIGTSLPELAASIMSARKGEHDIALGNVIGSNMFNTLGVLGLAAIINPSELADGVLTRDLPLMVTLTVIMFIMAFGRRSSAGEITRVEGSILLAIFITYEVVLYFSATA